MGCMRRNAEKERRVSAWQTETNCQNDSKERRFQRDWTDNCKNMLTSSWASIVSGNYCSICYWYRSNYRGNQSTMWTNRDKKVNNVKKKANKQNEDNMLSLYEHFIGLLYQLTKEVSQTEYNRLNIFIYNSEGWACTFQGENETDGSHFTNSCCTKLEVMLNCLSHF